VGAVFFACVGVGVCGEAQERLPTVVLEIGGKEVVAEVADEEHERSDGLMHRQELGEDEGMLFVMEREGPVAFWMRNTRIPLTIAYLDARGVVMELHDLEPFNEKPVASMFGGVAYALEVPQGWFTRNNVWPGERVRGLPAGPGRR
jgi:uncharacterized protein